MGARFEQPGSGRRWYCWSFEVLGTIAGWTAFIGVAVGGVVGCGSVEPGSADGGDITVDANDAGPIRGSVAWIRSLGGPNDDRASGLALVSDGELCATGHVDGPASLGGAELQTQDRDAFLARYSPDGEHRWSSVYGGSGADDGRFVAAGREGDCVVAGFFFGTGSFGGDELAIAGTELDVFVARYGPDGQHVWSIGPYGDSGDAGLEFTNGVGIDGNDNIVITGAFGGSATVNFGGADLTQAGGGDAFVVKYDADGRHLWSYAHGGDGKDSALGVATDASGGVLVTGLYGPAINSSFGGAALPSFGGSDVFVARYGAAGEHIWSRGFGSAGDDRGLGVVVDSGGDILVSGEFEGTIRLGNVELESVGGHDVFVARLAGDGEPIWALRIGGAGQDGGRATLAPGGDVAVAGTFEGTINLGGSDLVSEGTADGFVARFSSSGDHIWSTRVGGSGSELLMGIAVDQRGVYVSGATGGIPDLPHHGGQDIFVARLEP